MVIAVVAAVTAMGETRRVPVGSIAIVAAGVAGCAAVLSRAGATVGIVPTLVGTACGVVVLRLLLSGRFADQPGDEAADTPDPGRRLSLVTLGFLAAGVLSGATGVALNRRLASVAGDREAFALPRADVGAPPVPSTVQPKGVALPSLCHPTPISTASTPL